MSNRESGPGNPGPFEIIGTELSFDDFQVNPLDSLEPGNVITGVDGYRNLDQFEHTVATLVTARTQPYGTVRAEDRGRYLQSPLSGNLKP